MHLFALFLASFIPSLAPGHPAAPAPRWEGFYCGGAVGISIRANIESVTDQHMISIAAQSPGAPPKRMTDTILSRSENRLEVRSETGIVQVMTLSGDKLTVTQGSASIPMFRCDWLGDDGVFYIRHKTMSLKNFGPPECQPFSSQMAVFANDTNGSHTGSMTGTLFGRGVQPVTICRILHLSVAKARVAMAQALGEAGLQMQSSDLTTGIFKTDALDRIQAGIGPAFTRPFAEQFAVAVTPDSSETSRVTITRQVLVKAPTGGGWMRMSSDGYKEHWLLTDTLRLASLQ